MTKEIQLTNEQFNLIIPFIQKCEKPGKLSVGMNRKTYGGLITLNGTFEEIELFSSILENNGFPSN